MLLGYVHRLSDHSERMLRATKAGDTATMAEILDLKVDCTSQQAVRQIKDSVFLR